MPIYIVCNSSQPAQARTNKALHKRRDSERTSAGICTQSSNCRFAFCPILVKKRRPTTEMARTGRAVLHARTPAGEVDDIVDAQSLSFLVRTIC